MANSSKTVIGISIFVIIVLSSVGLFILTFLDQEQSNISQANWKTYKNDAYGFGIKYPNAVTVNEVPADLDPFYDWNEVDFYNKDKDLELSVSSWANENSYKTLDDLVKGEAKMQREGFTSVIPTIPAKNQKFILDGMPAIKWYYTDEKYDNIGVSVVTLRDKYFYHIEGKPYSEKYISKFTAEEGNLFNQMLSTFKFTK
ncbi:MAG: hypothetical protein NTV36_02695 [Candidatus Staskawiczbacteria bacterium]|nr:hypothetical protein [Candidatus Staskawiczbacteria bacterium]